MEGVEDILELLGFVRGLVDLDHYPPGRTSQRTSLPSFYRRKYKGVSRREI